MEYKDRILAALSCHRVQSQCSESGCSLESPDIFSQGVGRNVLLENLMPFIGQFPYRSPSVFNFYLPGFKPADFPAELVGPEFQIFTPPMAIGLANGLTSLIELGLGPCSGGFGFDAPQNCSNGQLHLGELECLQPTIDQLDLLLTGAPQNRKGLTSLMRFSFLSGHGRSLLSPPPKSS